MIEKKYEVNEFQIALFISLRAFYEDFGEALPPHISEELKKLVYLLRQFLDVDNNYGDIISEKYYRVVKYEN